ncbi:GIY-YIG nuclease family protein [Glaciihabitans sp. INWT7]|uniref:GIY-YIG nuclease family protein n=1 Tax=Glaciihabitans sp. INWT7 TaxID=2596912 RepID=UPI00162A70D9|nr:GIY-YIG nuclease family protein [Glaciihabitans sp. INWT7]QNE45629.1 GIY-YIG nuclease family protein [Glaciihabitans sp. INWT7]
MTQCVADDRGPCRSEADPAAPLGLCREHLLVAHDWVVQTVGVTDRLPSPCLACGSRLGVRYPSGWLCAICEWKVGDLPDQDASTLRVDVVYYILFRGRIKIGTSGNPRSRLASLPWEEVLAFERGDRLVEQRRHLQFASHRIPRTEWFERHDALLQHIDELQAGVDDPWAQYALWVSRRVALL